jgi:FKBP-type peptidyl-prolyl cis-trans isomerase FkpA
MFYQNMKLNCLNSFIVFLGFSVLTFSCAEKEKDNSDYTKAELKTILENSNKVKTLREEQDIENYFKRRGLVAQKTGTGVYFVVYEKAKKDTVNIEHMNYVTAMFDISLIDGKLCYSTKETGPLEFQIGKADIESGLQEALEFMHQGDKALILIPSHRAHGLLGDMEKIPSLATVIYDIKIMKVSKQ